LERKILVNDIVEFYFMTNSLHESIIKRDEAKIVIDDCLEKAEHIETIINTIIIKLKTYRNLDIDKIKEMLLELERVRLELEYKNYKMCDSTSKQNNNHKVK